MKTPIIAIVALIVVMGLAGFAHAFETDFDDINQFDRNLMWWKFGRGVTNVLSGPYELFTEMGNNAIHGAYVGAYDGSLQGYMAGSANGYIAGFFSGMYKGLRRMTTGALEIVTFWKPEYGPTLDPLYGTRDEAMGYHDFFKPEPFWYNGPAR